MTWQIREVCGVGKESRLFTLNKSEPLTVGQGSDCTLHLELTGVEKKHAVIEWNNKKLSYIVRDLGSTSGTFINNAPLTRGTEELKHGDTLRFGYEKTHLFRVEESFQRTTKSASAPHPPPTSTATHPSPQASVQVPLVLPQGVLLPPGGYFVSGGQQGAILTHGGAIQYILPQAQGLVGSPTVALPTVQGLVGSPTVSLPTAQGLVGSPIVSLPTAQRLVGSPTVSLPTAQGLVGSPTILLSTPPQQASPNPPPETTPTNIYPQQDIDRESVIDDILVSPKRSDGRRQADLSNTPSVATTSRLYGQPAWWGGEPERPRPSSDSEFKHATTRNQNLRDLDFDETSSVSSTLSTHSMPPALSTHSTPSTLSAHSTPPTLSAHSTPSTPARSSKLSGKDELRLKAITNSASQDQASTSTSFVVDFGPAPKSRQPKPRPRSADPSPIRAPPAENNRVSSSAAPQQRGRPHPTTPTHHDSPTTRLGRSSTVVKRTTTGSSSLTRSASSRRPTVSAPQHHPRASSLDRKRAGTISHTTRSTALTKSGSKGGGDVKHSSPDPTSRKKSGSTSKSSSTTLAKSGSKGDVKHSGLDSRTRKRSSSTPVVPDKSPSHSMVDKTYTKIGGQGSSDELQSSLSDFSLTSLAEPVVVKGEGPEGGSNPCVEEGSARKKWTEQSQTPYSLMFANIEARMRQLSKLAQGAARRLSSMKRELEEVGVIKREEHPNVLSYSPSEQNVPQWKFSQTKEVHNIFLSVKSVEKWLKDIDSTVTSLQMAAKEAIACKSGEAEAVDGDSTECYHDSIEDNLASCSESEGSD